MAQAAERATLEAKCRHAPLSPGEAARLIEVAACRRARIAVEVELMADMVDMAGEVVS